MLNEDDQIEAINTFIENKGSLIVHSLENTYSLTISDKSLKQILKMIEEDIIINWMNIAIINKLDRRGSRRQSKGLNVYEIEECYRNLQSKQEDYFVIPLSIYDLVDDEERAAGSILIKSKTFKKIIQMAQYDWEQFLNFIEVVITNITYSRLQKLIRRKSRISPQYIDLFNYIMIYFIKYKGKTDIEITSYSINRILNMLGLDIYDLIDYMNLNLLSVSYLSRREGLKTLKQKGFMMNKRRSIAMNESENIFKLKKHSDYADRLRRQTLVEFESGVAKGSEQIKKNKEMINKKKEEMKAVLDNDDTFIEVEDEDEKKVLIRKKLYREIISSQTIVEEYEIPDYNGNKIKVLKSKLSALKEEELDEYILIQFINSSNQPITMSVSKKGFIEAFDKWNSLNKIEEMENKISKSNERFKLLQTAIVTLEDVSLSVQPEELKIINRKKTEFRSGVLKRRNSHYIEYDNKALICSRLYDKITEHPGNFDEFTVKNHYDGKDVAVSKRKLKSKPKNNYAEYIEVAYSEKHYMVKKAEFENILNQWSRIANKIKLKNYLSGNDEEIDLVDTKGVDNNQAIGEQDDIELPYQLGEAKETKERIENDITEDNEFAMIPHGNILIRRSLIKEIKAREKDNEDTIYNVIDNDNAKRKLSRRAVLSPSLESYIEIIESGTNRKSYVKSKDLGDIIDDNVKDEADIKDDKGTIIHIKKSHIQVIKQPKVMLGFQIDQLKKKLKLLIKDQFVIVKTDTDESALVRKDYIALIKSHKQTVPFDRYEIPNADNIFVNLSKKAIAPVNLEKIDNYIKIKSKKDSSIRYVSQSSLMKYLDENYEFYENEQLELDTYDISQNKSEIDLKKIKIQIQDIEIIESTHLELPHQQEEALMKILLERRKEANEINDETDFVELMNVESRPIIIRKKIVQEIIKANQSSQFPRNEFKVVDSLTSKEEKINVSSINNSPSNASDIFTMITPTVTSGNTKTILVNKNQLRDCLNKADNPRCKLNCDDYVTKQSISDASVTEFAFTAVDPNVLLPLQDEVKLQKTMVASNDLDRVITTIPTLQKVESMRPEANDPLTDLNEEEFNEKEEVSELMHSETKVVEKPRMKPDFLLKQKKTFVIRRAIIRRVIYDK